MDAVELRLDLYPSLDVDAFLARAGKPVIATVRRKRDGGAYEGPEEGRRALFARARRAAYVDLETDADPSLAPAGPERIPSHHDLAGVSPPPPGARKIALTPRSAVEALSLLPLGAIGMGPYGECARVLAPLTYCARRPVAPGMPTPGDLFDLFRVRRVHPGIALYGVAGDPIGHSRSPRIHNPAFERDGIDAVYLRFKVDRPEDLHAFWPAFLAHRGEGLSITAPLKVEAARIARDPDGDVRESGAANTLLRDGRACNTDLRAFLDLLPREPSEALVLGAGGSARAALVALRRLGHAARVHARDPEKARLLGFAVAERPDPAPIVVNTTPLDPPEAPFVIDLRYGPSVRAAEGSIQGLEFLRVQARHQYRLFTGRELDRGVLLVGPRGAGKSTVGTLLARRLGLPFLDADREVEREAGRTVASLLADGTFRARERETLARLLPGPARVIAAGGGAVLWEGLLPASRGHEVVWLDAAPEILGERIRNDPAPRPSLTGAPAAEEIGRVAREREPLYRRIASFRIDTGRREPRRIVEEIVGNLSWELRPGREGAD